MLASYEEAAKPAASLGLPHLLAQTTSLDVDNLIGEVLARNPTLAQMTAAWQAAAAKYPQAISLDDPMFDAAVGPGTIGADDLRFAYRLEISQRYPWPGKRALRGEKARAEESAASHDVEDMRLQLIESARTAFYDYYLVERALAVNQESLRLLKEVRENALSRFRTGQAPQQDVLQADVELGRTNERRLALERTRRVTIARINTLMHLPTDAPVPPPPERISSPDLLSDVRELQAHAITLRPDLKALADRLEADKSSLALAYKEYYPDLEPYVMWDRFMGNQNVEMAPQVGVRLNVPVRKERRHAALAEAHAQIAQRQAELARQTDQVLLQVAEAYQQVRESERVVKLYNDTILPAARENVKAAIAAYTTGKVPFLSLIEAERNLVSLQDRHYEATADIFRRRATLERVIGGPLAPVLPSDQQQ
jgi:outer membrane protein TolC